MNEDVITAGSLGHCANGMLSVKPPRRSCLPEAGFSTPPAPSIVALVAPSRPKVSDSDSEFAYDRSAYLHERCLVHGSPRYTVFVVNRRLPPDFAVDSAFGEDTVQCVDYTGPGDVAVRNVIEGWSKDSTWSWIRIDQLVRSDSLTSVWRTREELEMDIPAE